MGTRRLIVSVAASAAIATVGAACTDLFHATGDIRSACAIDPTTPGCVSDFCALSSTEAQAVALRTCAWMGACLGPLGGNSFGACNVQARLAFDCATNPDHRVTGPLHDQWTCLAAARTCEAMRACLAPAGVDCPDAGDVVGCASEGTALRVGCRSDGGPLLEDCALWGQSCVVGPSGAVCGPGGVSIDCSQSTATCSPAKAIRACGDDGGQFGTDCSGSGGGKCAGFPDGGPALWVSCIPLAPEAPAACTASTAVECANGVAHSCPTGVTETVDCEALLGEPDACVPGTLAGGFDWTSACSLGGVCPSDSCLGTYLTSCSRGATFTVDCASASVGLGACHMVTAEGATAAAACSPP